MTTRLSILGFSLGLVILVVACGSGTNPSGSVHSASAPAAAPTVLVAQDMTLGSILTDASGRTLYQFSPEKGGKIVCTGACLTPWPAALSSGAVAGAGVTGTVALITRPEGGQQLTYNTWPLYYFFKDTAPDQTNGQGVNAFGGDWRVATPGLQP